MSDFAPGTDLHACAEIVQKGDPDRFAATMAAPVAARRVLFPIYAFNVEVSRAPWVTDEPIIAEMRLQWWRDALDEIAQGGFVRRHEVVTPLALAVDADNAQVLMRCVEARRRDARREPMENAQALRGYLTETGGALLWAATRALTPTAGWPMEPRPEDTARDASPHPAKTRAFAIGGAQALANYLLAVPAFLARGVNPLPEMSEAEFAALLRDALDQSKSVQPAGRDPRIAELAAWRTKRILTRALRDPAAVPEGRLAEPELLRRASLSLRALRL